MQDSQFILYSPSEAANSGAGFWSAEDGWTQFDKATPYGVHLRQVLPFPRSAHGDAGWVLVDSILYLSLAREFSVDDDLSQKLDKLDDRYGDRVIAARAELFDGLEIQGVREEHQPGDSAGSCVEVRNEAPQSYSVYVHYKPEGDRGGVECIGDFGGHPRAVAYAQELSKQYGWPVADFVPEEARLPSRASGFSVGHLAVRPMSGQRQVSAQF
ncbi:hypothetical protein [Cupriavidus sp. TMH.W2]|uniref:hypothetical protein n=1 Tax=Cupriavidus sp. TMH.W2 TaxID=3434465 RepID=UPI003D77FC8C